MEEIQKICEECLNEGLYRIIISNIRKTTGENEAEKVTIRPILVKGELVFQRSETRKQQIFHSNLSREDAEEAILKDLKENFLQAEFSTRTLQATVRISKKGKITVKRKVQAIKKEVDLSHNKVKSYVLKEGEPIPFLVDLGIQTAEGRIVKSRYDKFRQINRYLEFVEDIIPILPTDRTIHIIDFGCGKSYLTFALYYYMTVICKRKIRVTGLDLKEKVIEECNGLAQKYGYDNLQFQLGDVSGYETQEPVDMVVTLHACDTATDYALERAVRWNTKVIFSVPCCQHEVNHQIHNELLEPILKYGLLKERIAALVTDGIRANILEEQGYQVQVMEFIDMEHTPKNVLIRAIRDEKKTTARKGKNYKAGNNKTGIKETADFLGVKNTLQQLLDTKEVE